MLNMAANTEVEECSNKWSNTEAKALNFAKKIGIETSQASYGLLPVLKARYSISSIELYS